MFNFLIEVGMNHLFKLIQSAFGTFSQKERVFTLDEVWNPDVFRLRLKHLWCARCRHDALITGSTPKTGADVSLVKKNNLCSVTILPTGDPKPTGEWESTHHTNTHTHSPQGQDRKHHHKAVNSDVILTHINGASWKRPRGMSSATQRVHGISPQGRSADLHPASGCKWPDGLRTQQTPT